MTLEQLAELPVGTRLKFSLRPYDVTEDEVGGEWGYDYGTIKGRIAGGVHIQWDDTDDMKNHNTIVHPQCQAWEKFAQDLEVTNEG